MFSYTYVMYLVIIYGGFGYIKDGFFDMTSYVLNRGASACMERIKYFDLSKVSGNVVTVVCPKNQTKNYENLLSIIPTFTDKDDDNVMIDLDTEYPIKKVTFYNNILNTSPEVIIENNTRFLVIHTTSNVLYTKYFHDNFFFFTDFDFFYKIYKRYDSIVLDVTCMEIYYL